MLSKRLFSTITSKFQPHQTHQIKNQSKQLINFNVYESDKSLKRSVKNLTNEKNHQLIENYLFEHGKICGSESMIEHGILAEKNIPLLKQFDVFGNRIDVIDFHPSYHILMKLAKERGMTSYGYNNEDKYEDSHVVRSMIGYIQGQMDQGHGCPITMTNAAIPVLKKLTNYFNLNYVNKLCHPSYDPRNVPIQEKLSITAGMSMTEKQGGSDVRSNTTIAIPNDNNKLGDGNIYFLTGHKWFTSAPMCDIFLTLAKTPNNDNLSCFIVPRFCPDGNRNKGFKIMRLKNKIADRSNASSEVEYDNAWAHMIGEEGKGVKTIIEMVQSTRLDCTTGSASTAKRSLMEALNYTVNKI